MTLCDTGPLVALIDSDDPGHARCMAAVPALRGVLVTTWPCMTEAMHLLGKADGYRSQDVLWQYLVRGALRLHAPDEMEWERMRALMAQYRDTPMDLADASLVAAAEALNLRRVFTLDSHFRAYRMVNKHAFDIVP